MSEGIEIVKSKSDPKDYRLIKLSNGLRALLVSDLKNSVQGSGSNPTSNVGVFDSSPKRDLDDSSEMDESDSPESDMDSSCSDEISSDDNEMENCKGQKWRQPANDPKKQAAAALCINIGSFLDPVDLPGLAHFLEHMVFMGSVKYPDENKFDAFIRLHGGSDNAYTDCERTVFEFEIHPHYFSEALDIWAQFFISPLLNPDSIEREVKAVDSEFDMAIHADDCRKEQLIGTFFPESHPMAKFMWGNKKSLQENPVKNGIDVYKALKEFHKKYYLPHFMTLCLQSPEKLDTLEEWTRQIFEDIPCCDKVLPEFSFDIPSIEPFKVVKIEPVKSIQELHLVWILSPQQRYYKTKPLHYISWLVGHESRGSILSMLKQKNYALALCGGSQETGFEQNGTCSLFTVTITLTDLGFSRYCEVINIVFQYLSMLQEEGACERVFREIQKIEDIDFMFQEDDAAIENVVKQSRNILLYPQRDILTGDQLLFDYDPDCIEAVLSAMSRDRCLTFLSSPTFKSLKNPAREPWFGTLYAKENLPEDWVSVWSSEVGMNVDSQLHLPSPNSFIAERFDLVTDDCHDQQCLSKYPQLITDADCSYKLWFKHDKFFNLPKAYIHFHLVNPLSMRSPQNTLCLELLVHLLMYNLAEVAYDADAASLSYGAEVGDEGGLVLKFSGYSHKLSVLVGTVADYLVGFKTNEQDFKQRLLQHRRSYYNTVIKPQKLAKSLRLTMLRKFGWSTMDKYKACEALSFETFSRFVHRFLAALHIESLIQGNYSRKEAREIVEGFIAKIGCCKLEEEHLVSQRIINLGCVQKACKVKALNPTDDNSMVVAYFQGGPDCTRERSLTRLLESIMDEPCFDILRTKQQLGYSVFVQQHNTAGILGLTVGVATQNSKFSVEETSRRIMNFVTNEMLKIIQNMDKERFRSHVHSLISLLKNEDTHLGEEVDRNWREVKSRSYLFEGVQREIEFLQTCTLGDLRDFFTSRCLENNKILHVQVQGNSCNFRGPESSGDMKFSSGENSTVPPALSLEFLQQDIKGFPWKCMCVTSIEELKNSSSYFPALSA